MTEHARPRERVDAAVVVLHVTRGNIAVDVPLPAGQATFLPASQIAELVVVAVVELQRKDPKRASHPVDERSLTELALRPRGADEPIKPGRPLLEQTPGHWRLEDVPTMGPLGRAAGTRRLPVGAFELIDLERPRVDA